MENLKKELQEMFCEKEVKGRVVKVKNLEKSELNNLEKRYFDRQNNVFILTPIASNIVDESNITYVKIKKINIKQLKKDFFDAFDKFIITDEQNEFVIKEVLENIIYKYEYEYGAYSDKIIKLFIENKDFNIIHKGYQTFNENGIVTKKFIAKYLVLLYKKNNSPYVKLNSIEKDSVTLYLPNCRDYKYKDNNICMRYEKFSCFLGCNNIDEKTILIDPNSIDCFYSFNENYFVNPTTKWVEEWWNYDCPILYKYKTNKDRSFNYFKVNPICWDNILVETSWNSNYIDEDITEKEIKKFAGNYKHTAIYKSMINVIETKNLTEEQKKDMILKAKNYIEKIQKLIDENKLMILRDTVVDCSTNSMENIKDYNEEQLKSILTNLDSKMGLDCGFLYIKSENKEINDLILKLAEFNSDFYKDGSLKLEYPWIGQSTTIQRSMAKAIQKTLSTHNTSVSYWTELD